MYRLWLLEPPRCRDFNDTTLIIKNLQFSRYSANNFHQPNFIEKYKWQFFFGKNSNIPFLKNEFSKIG